MNLIFLSSLIAVLLKIFLKLGMDYLCQQSGFLQSRNYITNTQEFGLRYLIELVML